MNDILVAEDNLITRENIIDLMKENGYNVYGAKDGHEALILAKEILPDIIISDIMMPGLGGIELFIELSNDPLTRDIPFIFLSARSEPLDVRLGMELGADDYITKPFKARELLKAVEVRLKKREMHESKMKTLTNSISLSLPHELRTPLVAIMGYSELLKENSSEIQENDIQEISERIHYAGKRLNTTIEKFLIYSEIEFTFRDREQLKRIRNLHCDSVRGIITTLIYNSVRKYSRGKDVFFELIDADLRIEMTYLGYILSELADNACKFSEPGTQIRIKGDSDGVFYILEITDNGRGMTKEQISKVGAGIQFEKEYFQQSGNGLGLAIVQGLAVLHGGDVKIESKTGSYTSVRVSIPLFNNSNITSQELTIINNYSQNI